MGVQQRKKKSAEETTGGEGEGQSNKNVTPSSMRRLFGFELSDFSSWSSFVKLMNRPTDPASLGMTRLLFGLLMAIDIPQERGLSHADLRWGDPEECRFPLFNFLKVLPLEWMYVVYLIMFLGALGIMAGCLYRLSCLLFMTTYWYVFFLDKTSWNNHSYLYGLCGFMLFICDANRYCSVDGLRRPRIRNAQVPLWNYCILRTQFFLVYFIAGLKKLDMDWVGGYSMNQLSKHWVFLPFTTLLGGDVVDLWIVHRGGLFIDLTMGFFLFFDVTRPFAVLMGCSFHCMNSQLFSIGMFPFTMMATMPLFFYVDWPRKLFGRLPQLFQPVLPTLEPPQPSTHCVYQKTEVLAEIKEQSKKNPKPLVTPSDKIGLFHKFSTIFVLLYLLTQMFMPYSHFITKGYNNWTNGLYGYSWDMMVHSWSTQHIRITYIDKNTGKIGYLDPEAWTSQSRRWSSHADMMKQYATCITERLEQHNITEVELYFDVWRSLNDRFQQRMFDPRVDLVSAEWHPFKAVPWLMPLLTDLSDWRSKLDQIEKTIYDETNDTDVVFIADFPGLTLENFVQEDLGNTTITLLKGEVIVELLDQKKNKTLKEGQGMTLPAGEYHNVHTVSSTPSCYMYVFVNTTERDLSKNLSDYELRVAAAEADSVEDPAQQTSDGDGTVMKDEDPQLIKMYEQLRLQRLEMEKKSNATTWQKFYSFCRRKYYHFMRGISLTGVALQSIVTSRPFGDVYNETIGSENDFMPETI